jgi:hypothetical protein
LLACASGSHNETSSASHLIKATPACTQETHNAIRSNLPTLPVFDERTFSDNAGFR